MKINPAIFKAYDIRGIYPDQLNEDVAYLVGRATVEFLKKPNLRLVVSRDGRLSGPKLHKGLVAGLKDGGAAVTDLGLATTPMLYWACAHYKFDGGVSVTASHNPPDYNGLKIVSGKMAVPVGIDSGLKKIRAIVEKGEFGSKKKGRVVKKDVRTAYVKFGMRGFKKSDFPGVKTIIDFANAVPSVLLPELVKVMGGKVYPLFDKLDGNFPNHSPNPLIEKNLVSIKADLKEKGADWGVAFDGDGDRIIFVDEKARMVSPDLVIALLAESILKERRGAKIIYDLRSSNIVRETIKKYGGVPIMSRVGHTFIKAEMQKKDVLFGGESSGHYYHKNHYYCEAPLFVMFSLLKEMKSRNKTLSELIAPFKVYYRTEELNFKVADKDKIMAKMEKKYGRGAKVSHLDGIRIDLKDWWFNCRPSNTEPLLRLIVEAKTKELMEQKKKELSDMIS